MKQAYVNWNAGVCRVFTYPGQKLVCWSKDFRRATNKARRLGFHVTVYCDPSAKDIPKEALHVGGGGYVLPPPVCE